MVFIAIWLAAPLTILATDLNTDDVNFRVVCGNDNRKVRSKRALLGNPAALYTATFIE